MMIASLLESTGVLLTIFTPLVVVPLTAITFYLRSLREQQESGHRGLVRRVESIETSVADLRKMFADFERDYTTKEEWLRECMLARRTLEQLRETAVRLETAMQSGLPARRSTLPSDETMVGRVPRKHVGMAESGYLDEGGT